MAFIKRLGWYLVGVSIGLVFLAFVLKKKSGEDGINFCYLPNCRVLKDFRSKPLTYTNKVKEQISSMQLDSIYFSKVFADGDVNFGKSNTEAKPCKLYYVNFKEREIQLQNCEDKIIIERISKVE
jgi:hypothetical protein